MTEKSCYAKSSNYWPTLPKREVEALARCILPDMLAYFESEEGQREYQEWEAQQDKDKQT